MKEKIEGIRFFINNKLTSMTKKIQKAEDGFVGAVTIFGIVVVSYAVGYINGFRSK